jgi:arginine decarboxylase
MGQQVEYLDVGGGLAIDYDGSRSTFHSSMNYTAQEYAATSSGTSWTSATKRRCRTRHRLRVGRAIVAHHSVLVVEAFGAIEKTPMSSAKGIARPEHKLVRT